MLIFPPEAREADIWITHFQLDINNIFHIKDQ